MKNIVFSFLFLGIFSLSCSKKDDPAANFNNNGGSVDSTTNGTFASLAHTTTGTVTVNSDKTKISFNNFKTDPGPKLVIYLSSDYKKPDSDFIDLGDIKGVSGNYTYDLPSKVDLTKYKYVVVWCVDFRVGFGYAGIKI